jgi:hypothetical protein
VKLESRSRPISTAATKPQFQLLALVFSLLCLHLASRGYETVALGGNLGPATAYRLHVLGLRNPAIPTSASNTFAFGLLNNGCPLAAGESNYTGANNQTVEVQFGSSMSANGYYIKVFDGSPESDPIRWVITATVNKTQQANAGSADTTKQGHGGGGPGEPEGGAAWKVVGASSWRGMVRPDSLYPNLGFALPLERCKRVDVDCRPDWPSMLSTMVTQTVDICGWLLYMVAGMAGKELLPVQVVYSIFFINTCLKIASAIGYGAAGHFRSAADIGLDAIPAFYAAFLIFINERFAFVVLIGYGLLDVTVEVPFQPIHSFQTYFWILYWVDLASV